MTDETKKLFDAPWNASYDGEAETLEVYDADHDRVCIIDDFADAKHANRIARLPELFAYLLDRVYYDCSTCYCKNTGFLLQQTMDEIIDAGCPLKRKFCDTNAVFKLLMEVRDGKIVNKELKK